MKIGICPSNIKPEALGYIKPIGDYLIQAGCEVYIEPEFAKKHKYTPLEEKMPIDIYITIGGDGTLLAYLQKYIHNEEALFTCVNLGLLGFLADVPIHKIEHYLSLLVKGDYTIDERSMISGIFPEGDTYEAVNDIVFYRGSIRNMIFLDVKIDGKYLNSFQADGLIVATPTGSTAYSLAAGGPILDVHTNGFVMTPVSPHTLTSRPLVTSDTSIIEIENTSRHGSIEVVVDGVHTIMLAQHAKVKLTLSKKTFRLVSFEDGSDFYDKLRTKLNWKGQTVAPVG